MMLVVLATLLGGTLVSILLYVANAAREEYRRDRVPTLLYHRFLDADAYARAAAAGEDLSYVTEAGAFAAQMDHLKAAGYSTISLDQFLAFHRGEAALPARPIVITCDDGFASIHAHAFPVWRRLGMQATIFMTPDRASGNFARYARFDAPLTDAQLIEMSGRGVAIESHGMTHRYLSDLPEQAISWELEEARRTLAATTGRPIRFFAVPSGDYNRTVRRLTIRAGYEAVYCMRHGSNSRASDLYALRRLTVGKGFGIDDFRRLLTPAAACQLRLVNECHNLLRVTLGPRRLDALHDVLNRTGIRTWLRPGRLRVALILVAAVALLMLSALAFALFRGI